jgi:hypothetical protein
VEAGAGVAGAVERTLRAAGVPHPVQNLAVTSLPHLIHLILVGEGGGVWTGATLGAATGVVGGENFFSSTTSFGVTGFSSVTAGLGDVVTCTGEGFGEAGAGEETGGSTEPLTGNLFPFTLH